MKSIIAFNRKKILGVCFMLAVFQLQAQSFLLDYNNINARINSRGRLFNNYTLGKPGFECPKGSSIHTIYASGLWVGALDGVSAARVAGYDGNNTDWRPGPVMYAANYPSRYAYWDNVWYIYKSQINNHILNYTATGYTPAPEIANWPAHGDTTLGEPFYVAPFFDNDGNGVYDPMAGDYPLIKGDEATFQVFNDDSTHSASAGQKMRLQVKCMVYEFYCTADTALYNSVFVDYTVTNFSSTTYTETYFGAWTDFDMGYYNDDYVGTDVGRGLVYAYNGDNNDATSGGSIGYGTAMPMVGMQVLVGPKKDDDGLDNPLTPLFPNVMDSSGICYATLGLNYGDGITDNEYLGLTASAYFIGTGAPTPNMSYPSASDAQFYNYLTGKWKDGTSLYRGGVGYTGMAGVDTVVAHYAFSGDTDPYNCGTNGTASTDTLWREDAYGNAPADRVAMGISGPFTFSPGESQTLSVAYTFASSVTTGVPMGSRAKLERLVDSIRNYYMNDVGPCGAVFNVNVAQTQVKQGIELSVYPNPVSTVLTVDAPAQAVWARVYDIYGMQVMQHAFVNGKQVPVSSLNNGLYLLSVFDAKGNLLGTKRVDVVR